MIEPAQRNTAKRPPRPIVRRGPDRLPRGVKDIGTLVNTVDRAQTIIEHATSVRYSVTTRGLEQVIVFVHHAGRSDRLSAAASTQGKALRVVATKILRLKKIEQASDTGKE